MIPGKRYTRVGWNSTFSTARLHDSRRNNGSMRTAAPPTSASIGVRRASRRARRRRPATRSGARIARALGLLGLLGVVVSVLLIAAAAAGEPTQYVPSRSGGWPPWLAGPLSGLHLGGLGSGGFQTLTLIGCAGYALVLLCARSLSLRSLWVAIVLAHAILLLGPPLISQDVFGYVGFARMGALHGLDPYTHVAAQASGDEV